MTNQNAGFDVGKQAIGTVYAKALLATTEPVGKTETVLEEFQSLVEDVFGPLPRFEEVLASPRIGHEAKIRILDRVFGGRMSIELLTFLKVVSSHGRLDCLRAVSAVARRLHNELRGRVAVRLTTADPADGPLLERITNRLRGALRSEIDLATQTDPDLIGGMVVRVGDTVYDASVANHLTRLRGQALDKCVQQIQDRLDSFVGESQGK